MKFFEDPRYRVIPRTLRTTAAICFIGVVLTFSDRFRNQDSLRSILESLPPQLALSLAISVGIVVAAQIWLLMLNRSTQRQT